MIQLLLILLGLVSNPSNQISTNDGNSTISTQQSLVGDTGGEDGHIPIKK
ncbi:hypothetical protein [Epilithonimonas zeae]|nr:hypothetical protein [Epilithonimonas zeae]UQB70306.1 hypothetical protein KI430_07745 [Epilithonimonas zeae]